MICASAVVRDNGRGTLSLGNTNHFWQQTCLPFAIAGDINFIILNTKPFWFFWSFWSFQKEHYLYLSKPFTIWLSLEKYFRKKRQPVSLPIRHAEMQKNDRKLSLLLRLQLDEKFSQIELLWIIFFTWSAAWILRCIQVTWGSCQKTDSDE